MSKRLIASITLAAFTSLGVPAAALSSESTPEVSAVNGKVLVKQDGGSWMAVDGGSVAAGSTLRTGQDGSVVVTIGESTFRLAANTQVQLDGDSVIKLDRGRLIGRANSDLQVETDRTSTTATQGEFVVQTSAEGTGLDVLSGNAKLAAKDDVAVEFGAATGDVDADALSDDGLASLQSHGDVALLDDQWKGKWKGKGGGARSDDDDEAVGGSQQTSPDGDVRRPIRRPAPPRTVTPPPTPPVTPPVTPPATPPVTTTPPATTTTVASGGGSGWVLPTLLGAAAVTTGIIVLSDDDDDDTPSPATP